MKSINQSHKKAFVKHKQKREATYLPEKNNRRKAEKTLGPNTIHKHHAMIMTALKWSVKHEYISRNVALYAEPPKRVKPKIDAPYTMTKVLALLEAFLKVLGAFLKVLGLS